MKKDEFGEIEVDESLLGEEEKKWLNTKENYVIGYFDKYCIIFVVDENAYYYVEAPDFAYPEGGVVRADEMQPISDLPSDIQAKIIEKFK